MFTVCEGRGFDSHRGQSNYSVCPMWIWCTLRVTPQTSYSPEYTTPTHTKSRIYFGNGLPTASHTSTLFPTSFFLREKFFFFKILVQCCRNIAVAWIKRVVFQLVVFLIEENVTWESYLAPGFSLGWSSILYFGFKSQNDKGNFDI